MAIEIIIFIITVFTFYSLYILNLGVCTVSKWYKNGASYQIIL